MSFAKFYTVLRSLNATGLVRRPWRRGAPRGRGVPGQRDARLLERALGVHIARQLNVTLQIIAAPRVGLCQVGQELLALRLISTGGFEPLEWALGRELIQWRCHAARLLLRRAKYVRAARAGGSEVLEARCAAGRDGSGPFKDRYLRASNAAAVECIGARCARGVTWLSGCI